VSGDGVREARRKVLVDDFLGRFLAAAAAGTQAAAFGQMRDMNGAVFHMLADFRVGDGVAEAYVHDGLI
jgi:hypothetical protein